MKGGYHQEGVLRALDPILSMCLQFHQGMRIQCLVLELLMRVVRRALGDGDLERFHQREQVLMIVQLRRHRERMAHCLHSRNRKEVWVLPRGRTKREARFHYQSKLVEVQDRHRLSLEVRLKLGPLLKI